MRIYRSRGWRKEKVIVRIGAERLEKGDGNSQNRSRGWRKEKIIVRIGAEVGEWRR